MLVLALDTATPTVTVGVCSLAGDGTITEMSARHTADARAHAELLAPHISHCLQSADLAPEAIDAVVVGSGPGPFTSLRVGMATAAAYADALGIPVHPVCSLDAIAARARSAGRSGQMLVITDARRREAYYARYRADGQRSDGPDVGAASTITTNGIDVVVGDAGRIAELEISSTVASDDSLNAPDPVSLVAVASRPLLSTSSPEPLAPRYLRRPDAVPPRPRPLSPALRPAENRST